MTEEKKEDFIRVKVGAIMLDPFTNVPIVILKDDEEKNTVPIWIGLVEASAIAVQLEKVEVSRPLTHDLLKNIIISIRESPCPLTMSNYIREITPENRTALVDVRCPPVVGMECSGVKSVILLVYIKLAMKTDRF